MERGRLSSRARRACLASAALLVGLIASACSSTEEGPAAKSCVSASECSPYSKESCVRTKCTVLQKCVVDTDVGALASPVLGEVELAGESRTESPDFIVRINREFAATRDAVEVAGSEQSPLGTEVRLSVAGQGFSIDESGRTAMHVVGSPDGLLLRTQIGGSTSIKHEITARVFAEVVAASGTSTPDGRSCADPIETLSVSIAFVDGKWKVTHAVP